VVLTSDLYPQAASKQSAIMSARESSPSSDLKGAMEITELPESLNEKSGAIVTTGAAPYDKKATRRLLRKMDFYLIPFLSFLYL